MEYISNQDTGPIREYESKIPNQGSMTAGLGEMKINHPIPSTREHTERWVSLDRQENLKEEDRVNRERHVWIKNVVAGSAVRQRRGLAGERGLGVRFAFG